MGTMPVRHLDCSPVVTVPATAPVREVVEELNGDDVDAVVVVDGADPVGIVTFEDVALAIPHHDDVASMPAREVMTPNPVVLPESADAMDLPRVVDDHDVEQVPLVDADGNLTGIVGMTELVASVSEELRAVGDARDAYSPDYRW
ncbi:CBS domain-containing protein [Haloarculaceae archaeon H-GB11]|nr:CBS domain-containing protein [Haloarculaceae archaeon H-GB11]